MDIDLKLLAALQHGGRSTNFDLADRVGLSYPSGGAGGGRLAGKRR
ncbi:MAG: AsnC family protein [Hyphomicrobiaceae bacterium]|nr:MAG: AsnC family protein [Hyphomicrobiaceae bacterium]